jgi:hypothetical protein
MYFLFLSILLNAFISVIFGYFRKYNIDNFQAIVFNYGVCILTGSLVLGEFPVTAACSSRTLLQMVSFNGYFIY